MLEVTSGQRLSVDTLRVQVVIGKKAHYETLAVSMDVLSDVLALLDALDAKPSPVTEVSPTVTAIEETREFWAAESPIYGDQFVTRVNEGSDDGKDHTGDF